MLAKLRICVRLEVFEPLYRHVVEVLETVEVVANPFAQGSYGFFGFVGVEA